VARITRLKHRFVAPYKPVTISDAMLVAGCRTHQALLHSIEQVRARFSHPQYS
jgi:beta-N-acetylhexosaminidase